MLKPQKHLSKRRHLHEIAQSNLSSQHHLWTTTSFDRKLAQNIQHTLRHRLYSLWIPIKSLCYLLYAQITTSRPLVLSRHQQHSMVVQSFTNPFTLPRPLLHLLPRQQQEKGERSKTIKQINSSLFFIHL